MKQFKKPYLVQRLEKPRNGGVMGLASAFSFGGGLVNGGLSKEAMGMLKIIFSFNYMGSSEFEYGAVPAAFQLLSTSKLVCGIMEGAQKPVYYICDHNLEPDVRNWIRDEIAEKNGYTKESV